MSIMQNLAVAVVGALIFGTLLLINLPLAVVVLGVLFELVYPWIAAHIHLGDTSLASFGLQFFTPIIIVIAFFFGTPLALLCVVLLATVKIYTLSGGWVDGILSLRDNFILYGVIAVVTPFLRSLGLVLAGSIMAVFRWAWRWAFNIATGNFGFLTTGIVDTSLELLNLGVALAALRLVAFLV